jgi:hypothetical protein
MPRPDGTQWVACSSKEQSKLRNKEDDWKLVGAGIPQVQEQGKVVLEGHRLLGSCILMTSLQETRQQVA